MDYIYVARAEQTLEALNDAITVLEQREKIKANIQLYNYSLMEINRARQNGEVTFSVKENKFGHGRNFKLNEWNKYRTRAR